MPCSDPLGRGGKPSNIPTSVVFCLLFMMAVRQLDDDYRIDNQQISPGYSHGINLHGPVPRAPAAGRGAMCYLRGCGLHFKVYIIFSPFFCVRP